MADITQYGKAAPSTRGLLYGPNGEILLHGGGDSGGVGRYSRRTGPQGDVHLRTSSASGSNAFLEAAANAYSAANAYWDGSAWYRFDTAQAAEVILVRPDGLIELRTAPAGANPITWTSYTFSPQALACAVDPPRASMYRTTALSCNNVTHTAVPFDFPYINNAGSSGGAPPWASGNPTRFTAPIAGTYLVTASLYWAASAAGALRLTYIRGGGANQHTAQSNPPHGAANNVHQSVAGIIKLNAGDYVELVAYQDTGAALNVLASGTYLPHLGFVLLTTGQ